MKRVKPHKFWSDPKNILDEAKRVMKENNLTTLPNKTELAKIGHSSLGKAITSDYPNKFTGLREDLGEIVTRKTEGFWDTPINIEKEVRDVIDIYNLDAVPAGDFLRSINRTDLAGAISKKYPGGYESIREKFGETDIRKPPAYWRNTINIINEANEIIKVEGHLPGKGELSKGKYSSFAAAVIKYHGGFRKLRGVLGKEQMRVDDGYWHIPKNIENEVVKFKKETSVNHLPIQKKLEELGYAYLSAAISTFYPGGFEGYREKNQDFTPNQTRRKTTKKTPAMIRIEEKLGEPIETYLVKTYQDHSSCELSKTLGVSENTILLWLRQFNIKVRDQTEARSFRANKPSKEELQRLIYDEGKTRKELMSHYNIGHSILSNWINEYDLNNNNQHDEKVASCLELYVGGRQ